MISELKGLDMDRKLNDNIEDKIVTYFGYFEEHSLMTIAKTCAKLYISEHFKSICQDTFKFPTFEEMKELVIEEMKHDFDDKVIPVIEQACPDLTDDEIEAKVAELEKMYQNEHDEQVTSTVNAALKELKLRVRMLQKELKTLKRKYTI